MTATMAGSRRHPEYVLTIDCPDRPGIVFAVSRFLVLHSANILESQQFDDRLEDRFFMRVHFEVYDAEVTLAALREAFTAVASEMSMTWQLWDASAKYRTLVMVSKFGHCLNDLLYRQSIGALQVEIPAIISNHPDLEPLAKSYGVPFHHVPVEPGNKPVAEARMLELVESLHIDLTVLPATCRCSPTTPVARWPGGRSTSITPSCPASRVRGPTSRRSCAA